MNKLKGAYNTGNKVYAGTKTGQVLEWEVESKEKSLPYSGIEAQLRFLEGEVLTVIDASYSDLVQRKAVKDLVKGQFSAKLSWFYELCGYPNRGSEARSN